MSTCVITGCTLVAGGKWVGGDLHEEGDCYIFNAITKTDERGIVETAWKFNEVPFYNKRIGITAESNYFEKRGVIIFQKKHSVMNQAAIAYLAGA